MSNKLFNSVQFTKPNGNTFDLSHDVKMSGKMGLLMPTMVMDCVPGDKVKLSSDVFTRFAPLVAPIMHRVNVYHHYWAVPYRLVWPKEGANEGFESYISSKPTGGMPFITIDASLGVDAQKFLDYMEIPPFDDFLGGSPVPTNVSALPMACYQMIYNEFYRDQNQITEVDYKLSDGNNNGVANAKRTILTTMRKRAWEHDYFTSALPTAQKGSAVDLPLGQVELNPAWVEPPFMEDSIGTPQIAGAVTGDAPFGASPASIATGLSTPTAYNPGDTLQVAPTTVTDLRNALRLQEFLEKLMRAGSRMTEVIRAFFGVSSSDKRLDRPEYITGSKSPVIISEVLQMSQSDSTPQGTMAGHAVAVDVGGNKGFYFVEEHCCIIGIMSVMPLPAYQQGIPRNYLKFSVNDHYWPQFAHIGEQGIMEQELYAYNATKEDIWGYTPRYAEYKYKPSRVAGDFRSNFAFWHMGRIFGSAPTLSQTFLEMDFEEVKRVFAVEEDWDNLYIHILHKIRSRRLMAVYGSPMI